MIVRVMRKSRSENVFIGDLDASVLPNVDDIFWYDTHGPFVVKERTFIFGKKDRDDPYYDVTLLVEEISKQSNYDLKKML